MLASINPLGERARGQHYWVTVAAYVVASTVAAALLGALLGWAGAPLPRAAIAIVGVVALVALLAERFGVRVPGPRRQVNENWLVSYRGWVYGAGFGAQLGLAFVTIVTASATWIAFACALLAGSTVGGALVGAVFGLVRALPILSGARVRDPESLRALVRRLDRVRPRVATVTAAVQGVSALGLVALAIGHVA
ncbi:MAG TPA: hypothetical protein VH914_20940 [Acidimicrobiia bacterium]|nr:hypothetical protein [Acidimicrobiia bacterium]